MATLRIRLFGPPQVMYGDRPLTITSQKGQALLYYLAVSRQPHSREKLATLFWGEASESQAKGSLRNTLYELRRDLEPDEDAQDYILSERGALIFNTETDYWLDVEVFERKAENAELPEGVLDQGQARLLAEAVELHRGEFLEGFTLKDSYEFDDWSFFERDRLQRQYLRALERLSHHHAARGDYDQAIVYAVKVLKRDNLRESIHRHLMRLYYAAGNRSAALKQYQQCKEVLDRELGTPPLEETTELYEKILALNLERDEAPSESVVVHEVPPEISAVSRPTLRFGLQVPPYLRSALVGREAEVSTLEAALQEAGQGQGQLVMIEGEVGIGKTRLVKELVERLGLEDRFLMGQCYEMKMSPYQSLVDALRGCLPALDWESLHLADVWLREVSRLVPELGDVIGDLPQSVELDPAQERSRLFEGVTQFLIALSQQTDGSPYPLLLFLDDLHWADAPTVQFLRYLTHNIASEQILLIGACRSGEHNQALTQMVRSLTRRGLVSHVHLQRLAPDQVTAMIRDMAGMEKGASKFGRRIYEETEGNPFFIIEAIRSLFEKGVLQWDESGWTTDLRDFISEYETIAIPASVRDVIRTRVDTLDEDVLLILETAAVIRHSFSFGTIHHASRQSANVVLDAFDRLLNTELITEVEPQWGKSSYDFGHDKIREVVYQDMTGARRQMLHRRVSEALEDDYQDRPMDVVGRLAYHFAQAGDEQRALSYYIRAGDRAKEVYANEKAVEHYERALALIGDDREAWPIYEKLGDVCAMMGKHDEAVAAYENAIGSGGEELSLSETAELHRKTSRVYERSGDYEQVLARLAKGRRPLAANGPSVELVRLNDSMAFTFLRQGRYQEAIELCEESLEMLVRLGENGRAEHEWTMIHNTLGSAYLHSGEYEQALDHFQQGLGVKQKLSDAPGLATVYNNLGVVHYYRGDFETAFDYYQKSAQIKKRIGDVYGLAIACTNLGLMHYHREAHSDALNTLREAQETCHEIEAEWLLPEIHRIMAQVYLAQGDIIKAGMNARHALEYAEQLDKGVFIGVAYRVLGMVAAFGDKDWDLAEEHFSESVRILEETANDHELAKTCYRYGQALTENGLREKARVQLARAIEIFSDSGATGRLKKAEEAYEIVR